MQSISPVVCLCVNPFSLAWLNASCYCNVIAVRCREMQPVRSRGNKCGVEGSETLSPGESNELKTETLMKLYHGRSKSCRR